ncbi:MAG: hypothetical protein V5A64_03465 [Candidatus Thermoplasmatota archaeon]
MNKRRCDDKGQLLIVAGVLISIMIVTSAIVSVNLAATNKPVDKGTFIKSEFEDVRETFGFALQDQLSQDVAESEDALQTVFNDTKNQFSFAESRRDYYFNAEYLETKYVADKPDSVKVRIILKNERDSVSDVVYYPID